MVERAEFKMVSFVLGEEGKPNRWTEVGNTSILIEDLKRANIESYKDHHEIIWLSPIDGKCAHRVSVKQDPMKFIQAKEPTGEAKHGD